MNVTEEKHSIGEIVRTLERIETQVIRTNGRVNALEKWRWMITGGIVVLGLLNVSNISAVAHALAAF